MFKIEAFPQMVLTESGQYNPIRWAIVKRDGDTLTPTTAWFKCKDYFNDVVAAKNDTFFTQYGFDNHEVVEKGSKGLWVLVKYIYDLPSFAKRVAAITNKDHPVSIEKVDGDTLLLFIPEFYLVNTYRISLLTYLIRLCNQEVGETTTFTSVEQVLVSQVALLSQGLSEQGRQFALKHGWNAREGDKYWWRYGSWTSDKKFTIDYKSYIHNCGVNAWELNNKETVDAI
jgi:hypothetical protein